MLEVIDELSFPHAGEKDQWMKERSQWRLPYFDWGLPGLTFPDIFENRDISVQAPKKADGTSTTTPIKENPLYRYQLIVGGKPLAMGDPSLKENMIRDNIFEVYTPLHDMYILSNFDSGLDVQAQADGESQARPRIFLALPM